MILFLLGILFFGGVSAYIVYSCSKNAAFCPVKRLDKAGVFTNVVLCFFYAFFVICNFFIYILVTNEIGVKPELLTLLIKIISAIFAFFPFISIFSIGLSVYLRNRGKSIWSFVVQFVPLVIFGLNLLLFLHVERMRLCV